MTDAPLPEGFDPVLRLAAGPLGVTWLAEPPAGQPCVVRWVRCSPETAGRIRRAAAAAATLGPHAWAPRAVRDAPGGVHVVTDHAEAGSLADVLRRRGTLGAAEVVTLIAPLAQTLARAHEIGLGHGRIRASNVFFTAAGLPMLADFAVGALAEGRDVSVADDVRALATLGLDALGDRDASSELAAVLRDATEQAAIPAGRLAAAVLETAPAAPIHLEAPVPIVDRDESGEQPTGPDRRPWPRVHLRASTLRPVAARVGLGLVVFAAAAAVGHRLGERGSGEAVQRLPVIAPTASAAPGRSGGGDRRPWLRTMRSLARARAAAFRTVEPQALRRVYVAGSRPAQADAATLAGLDRAGLRPVGFAVQVRSARPDRPVTRTVEVEVVESTPAYDLVGADGRVVDHVAPAPLERRMFTLRRTAAGWRVESVGQPTIARTAASTSS